LDDTASDGTVTAVVADSDALVRSLVAAGLPFADLTVRGATLEEAFLTLTSTSAHTDKAA
jgi:ABC-2 type transport system ATP-binding protein